jgi:hypothetical protein
MKLIRGDMAGGLTSARVPARPGRRRRVGIGGGRKSGQIISFIFRRPPQLEIFPQIIGLVWGEMNSGGAIWGARAQLRVPPVGLMSRWLVGPASQGADSALRAASCEREASHVRHHWVAPAPTHVPGDTAHCDVTGRTAAPRSGGKKRITVQSEF